MNDDFLYKFRKPPRREFAAALYQRINQPMKTTIRTRVLRTVALSFAMVAVIATVLFFSPSVRAMAESIIRQIGGIIFVQATPQSGPANNGKVLVESNADGQQTTISPEQKTALMQTKIASQPGATSQGEKGQKIIVMDTAQPTLDANAISQQVGFTVLTPAYLPDGYTASSGGWRVSPEGDGGNTGTSQINGKIGLEGVSGGAFSNYLNQAAGGIITIEEFKVPQGQSKTVDSLNIQDVTVRGQKGV